jgi:hypothetical protein
MAMAMMSGVGIFQRGIDADKSLPHMPDHIRRGLIAVSFLGLLSLCLTGSVLVFIFYRLCNTKRYHAAPLRYNQSLILITNLLLADFQQALSFTLSLRWVKERAILAPTVTCNAQGWLIQIGDLSSGIFSLAIALQTFSILVLRKHLPYGWFVVWVIGLWAFCVTLSLIGPLTHIKEGIFVAAGVWCWIDPKYTTDVCASPMNNWGGGGGVYALRTVLTVLTAFDAPLPLDLRLRVRLSIALCQYANLFSDFSDLC